MAHILPTLLLVVDELPALSVMPAKEADARTTRWADSQSRELPAGKVRIFCRWRNASTHNVYQ